MNPKIEQNEGRQGVTGHGVRYVLAISLTAAIIACGIVYLVMFR